MRQKIGTLNHIREERRFIYIIHRHQQRFFGIHEIYSKIFFAEQKHFRTAVQTTKAPTYEIYHIPSSLLRDACVVRQQLQTSFLTHPKRNARKSSL